MGVEVKGAGDGVVIADRGCNDCNYGRNNSGWGSVMNNNDIPVWEKYTLTIEEASKYFRIGENKLRRLAEENKDAGWLIMNGNRIQIKRRQFEQVIDKLDAI